MHYQLIDGTLIALRERLENERGRQFTDGEWHQLCQDAAVRDHMTAGTDTGLAELVETRLPSVTARLEVLKFRRKYLGSALLHDAESARDWVYRHCRLPNVPGWCRSALLDP